MKALIRISSILRRGGKLAKNSKEKLIRQLTRFGTKILSDAGGELLLEISSNLALHLFPGIYEVAYLEEFKSIEGVSEYILKKLGKGKAFALSGREELFDSIVEILKEKGKVVDLKRGRRFFVDTIGREYLVGELKRGVGGLSQGIFGKAIVLDDGSAAAAISAYALARKGYKILLLKLYPSVPELFPFRSVYLDIASYLSLESVLPGLQSFVRWYFYAGVARAAVEKRGLNGYALPLVLAEGSLTDPRYLFTLFSDLLEGAFLPVFFLEQNEIAKMASSLGIKRERVLPDFSDFNPTLKSKAKLELEFLNIKEKIEKAAISLLPSLAEL